MIKTIAILYHDLEKAMEMVTAILDLDEENFQSKTTRVFPRFTSTWGDGQEWEFILCEGTYEAVMWRFSGEILYQYIVADEYMYDGKALMYIASRLRYVEGK